MKYTLEIEFAVDGTPIARINDQLHILPRELGHALREVMNQIAVVGTVNDADSEIPFRLPLLPRSDERKRELKKERNRRYQDRLRERKPTTRPWPADLPPGMRKTLQACGDCGPEFDATEVKKVENSSSTTSNVTHLLRRGYLERLNDSKPYRYRLTPQGIAELTNLPLTN